MRSFQAKWLIWSVRVIASVLTAIPLFSVPVEAYTGGPTRAYIAGLDTTTNRVFYWRTNHRELSGRELWFFDLNGEKPEQAQYVPPGLVSKDYGDSTAIKQSLEKLVKLKALNKFDLSLTLDVDSIGRHPDRTLNVYKGYIKIATESGLAAVHELAVFCEPMIIFEGLYAIPGREEAIAMITCIGHWYGCEEVDQPVLLRPNLSIPFQSEDDESMASRPHPEPFVFGKTHTACCGAQFFGTLFEGGDPYTTPIIYLVWNYDRTYQECSRFWIVNLLDSNSEPILFEPCGKDSANYGREILGAIKGSNRRRSALVAEEHARIRLHFSADSIGYQEDSGLAIYRATLKVESPNGSGACSFTTICQPIISVRGIYPLPLGAKLLIVAYIADPLGCDRKRREAVIWGSKLARDYPYWQGGWGKQEIPLVIFPNK